MHSLQDFIARSFMWPVFVFFFPPLLLTTAFPRTLWHTRHCSVFELHLYQPEQDVKSVWNLTSITTGKEQSLRELCRDMMKNTAISNHSSVKEKSSRRTTLDVVGESGDAFYSNLVVNGEKAIEQVVKILDIFNETAGYDGIGYVCLNDHSPVASKSIEGVLRRFLLLQQRETSDRRITREILEQLESLIWRSRDYRILPTQSSLEMLRSLQDTWFKRHVADFEGVYQKQSVARHHVGKALQLWNYWSQWAGESPSRIAFPTIDFSDRILCVASDAKISMTIELWNLYKQTDSTRSSVQSWSRDFFTVVLGILSVSPPLWQAKQTIVLKRLDEVFRLTNDSDFAPTIVELESALRAASKGGLAQDATWLFQKLSNQIDSAAGNNNCDAIRNEKHLELWFHAMCNDSNHERWLPYLEYLLLFDKFNLLQRLQCRKFYNQYLHKLARSSLPDSGIRAEAFFVEWKHKVEQETPSSIDSWCPDKESIDAVVQAHLQASGPAAVQRLQAERFRTIQSKENSSID
jgi:hypothetical protein